MELAIQFSSIRVLRVGAVILCAFTQGKLHAIDNDETNYSNSLL